MSRGLVKILSIVSNYGTVLFMSVTERTGEIITVDQIVDPERAQLLGNTVRSLFRKYVKLPRARYRENGQFMYDESDLEVSALRSGELTDSFWIGKSDKEAVDQALSKFRELLEERGVDAPLSIDAEFFVGTAGGADWHFDPEEYRLLVNLTGGDLRLHVANNWGPDDYEMHLDGEIRFKPEGPAVFDTLTYGPGGGVLLDNMCEPLARVPHAGVVTPDKVFLRAYAVHPEY